MSFPGLSLGLLWSRKRMSAHFPLSSDPTSRSIPRTSAPPMVAIRRISSGGTTDVSSNASLWRRDPTSSSRKSFDCYYLLHHPTPSRFELPSFSIMELVLCRSRETYCSPDYRQSSHPGKRPKLFHVTCPFLPWISFAKSSME